MSNSEETTSNQEEEVTLTRSERKKKNRDDAKAKRKKDESVKKTKNIGIGVAVVVAIVGGYLLLNKNSSTQELTSSSTSAGSLEELVKEFPNEGVSHVPPRTEVEYNTNPPTSGNHYARAAGFGVYNSEVDDRAAIHGLEHGGIWISYKNLDKSSVKALESIAKANPRSVILAPREANDNNIEVVSWGRKMSLDSVDEAMIKDYIQSYINKSPEKFAQ